MLLNQLLKKIKSKKFHSKKLNTLNCYVQFEILHPSIKLYFSFFQSWIWQLNKKFWQLNNYQEQFFL